MTESGSGYSPALARWAIPMLFAMFALTSVTLQAFSWHREAVFEEVSRRLREAQWTTVDELRQLLGPLVKEERYFSVDPPPNDSEGPSFIFSPISKLHLWVVYEPESGKVTDHELVYFASEPVDLDTGEGLGGLANRYFTIGLTVLCLGVAVAWYRSYPRLSRTQKSTATILVSALAALLTLILGTGMLNFLLFL